MHTLPKTQKNARHLTKRVFIKLPQIGILSVVFELWFDQPNHLSTDINFIKRQKQELKTMPSGKTKLDTM